MESTITETTKTTAKPRLLTMKQAAEWDENLTLYQLKKMIKNGELRTFRHSKSILIAENELYRAVFGKFDDAPPSA